MLNKSCRYVSLICKKNDISSYEFGQNRFSAKISAKFCDLFRFTRGLQIEGVVLHRGSIKVVCFCCKRGQSFKLPHPNMSQVQPGSHRSYLLPFAVIYLHVPQWQTYIYHMDSHLALPAKTTLSILHFKNSLIQGCLSVGENLPTDFHVSQIELCITRKSR